MFKFGSSKPKQIKIEVVDLLSNKVFTAEVEKDNFVKDIKYIVCAGKIKCAFFFIHTPLAYCVFMCFSIYIYIYIYIYVVIRARIKVR